MNLHLGKNLVVTQYFTDKTVYRERACSIVGYIIAPIVHCCQEGRTTGQNDLVIPAIMMFFSGARSLLLPLLFSSTAMAVAWPRCQPIDYERYMSAKDDPVTGKNGYGPRGFYIFHKDWTGDGDPCLFLDIMSPGFASEHPFEHNFFMYLIQYDVDSGIDRDGWLGDAKHMRDTKAVLKKIGRIPEPKGFHVIEPMGPQNDPEREAERMASQFGATDPSSEKPEHVELK